MKNDYLAHHGVLGMKWGVRRYQPYPSGKTGSYYGRNIKKDNVSESSSEKEEKKKKKKEEKR